MSMHLMFPLLQKHCVHALPFDVYKCIGLCAFLSKDIGRNSYFIHL